jgi:uncharacterized protein YjbI with pentapeptide repeats
MLIKFKNGTEKEIDNLSDADLREANLREANLREADLREADLSYANLRCADLRCADLRCADLRDADLRDADLRDANLNYANLIGTIGNSKEIKSLQLDAWLITYTRDVLAIGYQQHTISEWREFTDEEIEKMDSAALEWWRKWKEIIFKIIEMSPAENNESKTI